VRAGGALVAEARLGWNNERGWASEIIPGLGLHTVMGARETAVQTVAGLRTELAWDSTVIPGLRPGEKLPGRLYEESFEPLSPEARVVARWVSGAPAAVVSSFGRGKTLMLGSYLGAAYESQKDPVLQRFFTGLLEWAGIERPIEVSGAELEVRLLEASSERLLVAFNHQPKPQSAVIKLRASGSAADLASDQPVPVTRDGPWLQLEHRFAAEEVWLVRLTPR
jgi:beta-galactosidase